MSNIDNIVELSDENFDSFVAKSPLPILVDFYADWCGPCRMMSPVLSSIAEKMKGRISVAKVNVDNSAGTANKYKVQGIPFFLLIKNGKVVDSKVGASHEDAMVDFISKNI